MSLAQPSKSPSFSQQNDEIPLLCPICQHEIIPANVSTAENEETNLCNHVTLQHLWGEEANVTDPAIESWWISMEEKRNELEDKDLQEETLYRECPCIEFLVEHTMYSPGRDFVASFGFKKK